MRIEICGGIASGKTSFTKILHNENIIPVYENFQLNPFWEPFYSNPGKYIFETEITFLLQHYHDIKKSLIPSKNIVSDFSFFVDLAYANIGLTDNRLKIFYDVFDEILPEIDLPTTVINLICDEDIQLMRIKNRSRDVESSITKEFLSNLNSQISSVLGSFKERIKIITINSGQEDFVNNIDLKKKYADILTSHIL